MTPRPKHRTRTTRPAKGLPTPAKVRKRAQTRQWRIARKKYARATP